jgi:hypothetical protein
MATHSPQDGVNMSKASPRSPSKAAPKSRTAATSHGTRPSNLRHLSVDPAKMVIEQDRTGEKDAPLFRAEAPTKRLGGPQANRSLTSSGIISRGGSPLARGQSHAPVGAEAVLIPMTSDDVVQRPASDDPADTDPKVEGYFLRTIRHHWAIYQDRSQCMKRTRASQRNNRLEIAASLHMWKALLVHRGYEATWPRFLHKAGDIPLATADRLMAELDRDRSTTSFF